MCKTAISMLTALFVLACHAATVYAQEQEEGMTTIEQLKPKLDLIQNPFKSKLPEPEPEPEPEKPMDASEMTESSQTGPTLDMPVIQEPPLPVPTFTVTGIVWDSDRPQAIMNGQIVNIGDIIADVMITAIQKTEIRGTFHGADITIKP